MDTKKERSALGLITPKCEGMAIPRAIVEKYRFGVCVNYPHDEFVGESIREFGEYPHFRQG